MQRAQTLHLQTETWSETLAYDRSKSLVQYWSQSDRQRSRQVQGAIIFGWFFGQYPVQNDGQCNRCLLCTASRLKKHPADSKNIQTTCPFTAAFEALSEHGMRLCLPLIEDAAKIILKPSDASYCSQEITLSFLYFYLACFNQYVKTIDHKKPLRMLAF